MRNFSERDFFLTLAFAFFLASLLVFSHPFYYSYTASVTPPAPAQHILTTQQGSPPAHLFIPAIKVDAPIEFVGLTADGNVGAPVGRTDAAWFDESAVPGDVGNAIIDGHRGWKGGKAAVFDNLHKLKVGDEVDVQNEKGEENVFAVREMRVLDANSTSTTDIFHPSDDGKHLILITCNGDWDAQAKSYVTRLVVFADFVGTTTAQ